MQASTNRPPAPKARSGATVTWEDGERRRSRLLLVVRGCPLGTVQDRCEWHACGTAVEDEPVPDCAVGSALTVRVRPIHGYHHLVGKSPKGSRQPLRDSVSTARRLRTRSGSHRLCDLRFTGRPATIRTCCCPSFARRLRTRRGPGVARPVKTTTLALGDASSSPPKTHKS
jgi:hypothetical protein